MSTTGESSRQPAAVVRRLNTELEMAKSDIQAHEFRKAFVRLGKAGRLCDCYQAILNNRDTPHRVVKPCHFATHSLAAAFFGGYNAVLDEVEADSCQCGRVPLHCDSQTHMEILETMVHCAEMLKDYVNAISVSCIMVRMSAASPTGYCRLIKVLRYVAVNPSITGFDTWDAVIRIIGVEKREDLGDLLRCVAGIGSSIVNRHGDKNSPKAVVLQALAKKLVPRPMALADTAEDTAPAIGSALTLNSMSEGRPAMDPVMNLPRELSLMVFSYLSANDLLRCFGVNKTWKNTLSASCYWKTIVLNRPIFRYKKFDAFFRARPDIEHLSINGDSKKFWADRRVFSTIFSRPRKLRSAYLRSDWHLDSIPNMARLLPYDVHKSQLRKLTLVNIATNNAELLAKILRFTVDKLEELTLIGVPDNILGGFKPGGPHGRVLEAPALKVLRIEKGIDGSERFDRIRMTELVTIAPNLEQLCLDGFILFHEPTPAEDLGVTPWSRLRVLVLGPKALVVGTATGPGSTWFHRLLNPQMRVVDVMSESTIEARAVFFETVASPITNSEVISSCVVLPNLEVFRCRGQLDSLWLEQMIGPAIVEGNLHSLDVCLGRWDYGLKRPVPEDQQPPPGKLRLPATELSFTFSEHITTLGLRDFEWSNTSDYYSAFNPKPFLEWLDHFPNVHTVRVYPGPIADGLILFLELLKRSDRVKVIYQDSLDLKEYYVAKAEADKRGVILHHKYKEMAPARFPYPVTWE